MSWFKCSACTAKDAEIARLTAMLQASIDRAEHLAGELLNMARETAGLHATIPASLQPVAAPPLDPVIELFLDAKFVHGTQLWRQQRREAVKLVAEGIDAERITDTLARGQEVVF